MAVQSRGERSLRVRLGELELDERARELRGPSGPMAIQPKVFDVLVYLVRTRERVVSRDELQRAVWPDVSVAPDSITRALREVRRLVGADVVKTFTGRGVRYVGPVADLGDTQEPESAAPDIVGLPHVIPWLDGVLAGRRGALRVIVGAPGCGKSTVLALAEAHARLAGRVVVRSTPSVPLEKTLGEVAASHAPALVVIDDISRTGEVDVPDARRVMTTVDSAPVVVLVACCTSSRAVPRVGALLAAAARRDPDAVLTLGRLERDALAELARRVLGRTVSPAGLSKLETLTGGNPRFARHVLHLARQAQRPLETLDALPTYFDDRLRELVLEHVDVAGPDTRELLDAISIVDEPVSLDVAASLAAVDAATAADRLAEAAAVGLLAEEAGNRWRFMHSLVRTILERTLAPSRRATLHARAAVTLERTLGTPARHLERIVRHYVAGASVAHAPRALELVERIARSAVEDLAFARAASWYAIALDVEAAVVPAAPARRRALWLELAKVLSRDGQVERAVEALASSGSDAASARRDGNPVRTAFLTVAPELPHALERFYALLFQRHPQLRAMFTRSLPLQRRMFGETIATFVDHADDPAWLRVHLAELGRRHAEYGATEEMYGWVRAAFLDALEQAMAPRPLEAEIRETWERTLDDISQAMLAAQSASTPPFRREPSSSGPRGRRRASAR